MRGTSRETFGGVFLTGAAALACALGGCYAEGGPGYSADQFTYVSTTHQPKTVTIRDTRTGADFFSIEIPVGKQLVIDFDTDDANKLDQFKPDVMRYALMDPGENRALNQEIGVPPASARRIDVMIRTAPELPPAMLISDEPAVYDNGTPADTLN